MTSEKKIEIAARKLCELRGIDPEASVGHGAAPNADGSVPCVLIMSPAWRLVANEVRARIGMDEALAFADATGKED